MRFSDGAWLTAPCYEISTAAECYETMTDERSVTVYTSPYTVWNRAMTLGGVCLTITYTAVAPDIIKVNIRHHRGDAKKKPCITDDIPDSGFRPVITEDEEYIEMKCGETVLRIKKGRGWDVSFMRNGRRLTASTGKSVSYIKENAFHAKARCELYTERQPFDMPPYSGTGYIREQLSLDAGECVYGFGEKFTAFVKNGQTADMWNSDGGTSSDRSYKCIPFYVTSKGYGVFVNSTGNVSFETATENTDKVSFSLPGEELEYFFIGGGSLSEVIVNYTDLTGKPALPPANTFGLWLSTSFTTEYDEKIVMSLIDGMQERDIPLSMFHFDCFWMREYHWTDFVWDDRHFPEPEKMLREIRERGIGICCWINPYISDRACIFDEAADNGYFIKNTDGSIYQTDFWQPGMAIVDFTNPAACKWFSEKIKSLLEMGITSVKTDFGERIPADALYFSGEDPVYIHNYYSYLYNKTVFDTLESFYGKGEACLFARSATAGCQKFPVHWGGDCTGEFSSMAATLRGGLSLSLSGFGFFSHDIGGFEYTASESVYKRWCAFGLLSTHSRLHGSYTYRVPWVYDDEAVDVLRFFTKLKGRLMPYIFSQAVKTSRTGIPMMRPMVLDFTEDKACRYLDEQYMLGDSLLCAPVFNEEGTAEFYLPEGIWHDLITGRIYEGGRYHSVKCSFMEMPLLAKPCSIIAMGNFTGSFEYDYADGAELLITDLPEGRTASAEIYDKNSELVLSVSAERTGNAVSITSHGKAVSFTARLIGTDKCVSMHGGECDAVIRL